MTHQAIGDLFSLAKGRKAPEVFAESAEGIDRYIQIEDLRSDSEMKYAKDGSGTRVVSTDICIAWDGANAGTVGYGLTGLIGSLLLVFVLLMCGGYLRHMSRDICKASSRCSINRQQVPPSHMLAATNC